MKCWVWFLLLCLVGCRSSGPTRDDLQNRELGKLHERGSSQYLSGDYTGAIRSWEKALDQAYQQDDLESAARMHYHLALADEKLSDDGASGSFGDDHLLIARQLQEANGGLQPWLQLVLAEKAVSKGSSKEALTLTRAVIDSKTAEDSYLLQAHLIQAELALQKFKRSASKKAYAKSMDACDRLLDRVDDPVLLHRVFRTKALHQVMAQPVGATAVEDIDRALQASVRAGLKGETALHLYERSRLEILLGQKEKAVLSVYQAAQVWRSLGQSSTGLWALLQTKAEIDGLGDGEWKNTLVDFQLMLEGQSGDSLIPAQSNILFALGE